MALDKTTLPVIPADGLELRPLHEADAAQLAQLCNNPRIARILCSIPFPCTTVEANHMIGQSRDAWRDEAGFPFAIFRRDNGQFVGATGATVLDGNTVEISYWVGESFWGRGYASRAVRALVGFLLSMPEIDRIIASHSADNPASAWVLEKAGLRHNGEQVHGFSQGRGRDLDCRVMELNAILVDE